MPTYFDPIALDDAPRRDVDALSVMRLTRSGILNFSFFGRISNQRTETAAADRARLFP